GFITLEGQRISKTAGNTIDPVELVAEFGVDAVRYNLLRNLSFESDGDFSCAGLLRHYNDELANDLGNLLNRVVSMIKRYRNGTIPVIGPLNLNPVDADLQQVAAETLTRASAALDAWEIGNALGIIWNFVRKTNQYIEVREPWRVAKRPEQQSELDTILYSIAEAMRLIAIYLAPFLPSTSNRILGQLGLGPVKQSAWVCNGTWGSQPLTHVTLGPLLFPRIDTP
ncbi:MAG TPA: class I tRNA ligase family protein, partial [Ktedonobacteraceae bacterium]|nr:class I tRNA ligase family protein [Ktedonobacteraceae bacterium]